MRTAERAQVAQNAEYHRNMAAYYRERAGVPAEEPQQQPEAKPEDGTDSEPRRATRRAEQQPVPDEKPEDLVIAEMHENAAQHLEDLVATAPGAPSIAGAREAMPDNLRRANVPPPPRGQPTGVSQVHLGPPARR